MKLTVQERTDIERWRRTAYIVAKGMGAGLHRTRASAGELSLIQGASDEMRDLVMNLVRLMGKVPVDKYGTEIVQLGLRFLLHPPQGLGTVADLMSVAAFLDSIGKNGPPQEHGEEETRLFLQEFHEFLHEKVLSRELPESRATSLEAAHG